MKDTLYQINGYPKEFTLLELVHEFQQKAGCIHTQDKAYSCWKILKPLLEEIKYKNGLTYEHWIGIAWRHHNFEEEGREELDYWCNLLKDELKHESAKRI